MRKLDAMDLKTCQLQGEFFQETLRLADCGSAIAVRRFMNSDLARRIDRNGLIADNVNPRQMMDEIEQQYGSSDYGSEKYATEVLYWMGYVYRYWCLCTGRTSQEVYRICPAREMATLYFPYHSLDPIQAIERICEAKNTPVDQSTHSDGYIEEGVEALRRIHARSSYDYYAMKI